MNELVELNQIAIMKALRLLLKVIIIKEKVSAPKIRAEAIDAVLVERISETMTVLREL